MVAAITPSTNPGATPANNIINALKGRNAIVLAPSPKGASTLALLLRYIHAELDRIGAPRDLVQALPDPVTREHTRELMRQADLVVATGSQNNVRAAYQSGTPALGVGAGNVAVIVDETADVADAADKIARSKTFDNATSCSSENSVIVVDALAEALVAALAAEGGVVLDDARGAAPARHDVPGRQAGARGGGAAGGCDRARGRTHAAGGDRRAVPDCARNGRRARVSVLGREARAGARAVSRRRFRRGHRAGRAVAALPGRRAFDRACTRGGRSARRGSGSRFR